VSIFPTKILLATDGSEEAQLALSTAVDIATSTNSELHVVTVGPWNPDPAYAVHEASFRWETYQEASEAIGKEAREILDQGVRKTEEAGGECKKPILEEGEKTRRSFI
jgi:nucleotide-binding universal stress UspA family protein